MIDELQHAIELAQQQSEDEQRRIAQLILEELQDSEWEASDELATAITEAHEEVASGDVMDFKDYDRAPRTQPASQVKYDLRTPKRVQKELDALPDAAYARVSERVQRLSDDSRPSGVKKLKGRSDPYRIRVGSYRVVYEVDDALNEVTLITVSDRKDAYR